jgi:hypothetical protein
MFNNVTDSWLAGQGTYSPDAGGPVTYNYGNGVAPADLVALGLLPQNYTENQLMQAMQGAWQTSDATGQNVGSYSPEFSQFLQQNNITSRVDTGEFGGQQGFYGTDGQQIGTGSTWSNSIDNAFGVAMLAAAAVATGGVAAAGATGGTGTTAGLMGQEALQSGIGAAGGFSGGELIPGLNAISATEANQMAGQAGNFLADGSAVEGGLGGMESSWNFATPEGGFGGASGASGASGATNAALIDSYLGTPGYGLSSAGAGGDAGEVASGSLFGNIGQWAKDNPELLKLIGGGANALIGGVASNSAKNDLVDAANQSNALQREMYEGAVGRNAPYLAGGTQAFNALLGKTLSGEYSRAPSAQEVMATPGYQFGLDQGQQAINRQLNARGMSYSGAQGKALARYGTDYATGQYNNSYNRLMDQNRFNANQLGNLANMGQSAANNTTAAGTQFANQTSSNLWDAGKASANNALTQGTNWNNWLNQGISAYTQPRP